MSHTEELKESSKSIQKNSLGFYDEKEFSSLSIDEKLKLMIKETSYQEVMNVVRIEAIKINLAVNKNK